MPNAIAYLMLFAWPFIAGKIYKKVSVLDAAVLLFLVPYLLLPVKTGVDLPLLPMIDKNSLASLVALFLLRQPLRDAQILMPRVVKICWIALFCGTFMTVLLNSKPLVFSESMIPGLRLWDFPGVVFGDFFTLFIPYLIGFRLLASAEGCRRFVYWFAVLGMLYLIPMLWEVRMSPQLHTQIYGFFPHDFSQQIRQGGFRPVVFIGHGLLVAVFTFSAAICAYAWMKGNAKLRGIPSWFAFLSLFVGVILCRSLNVLFYLLLSLALLFFLTSGRRYLIMLMVAFTVLFYPAVRDAATRPLEALAKWVEVRQPERAGSLRFRLHHEEALLEKANLRPWFGWGSWGRNRVFDEAGNDISVTDGVWILLIGVRGWVGYLGFMGVLVLPFWYFWRMQKQDRSKGQLETYAVALLMVLLCNLIDFIPNSSLSHLTFLIAGALTGAGIRNGEKSRSSAVTVV